MSENFTPHPEPGVHEFHLVDSDGRAYVGRLTAIRLSERVFRLTGARDALIEGEPTRGP